MSGYAEGFTRNYTTNQRLKIANNMIRFGGSFMSKIGEALLTADVENSTKIYGTWQVECEKYLNI